MSGERKATKTKSRSDGLRKTLKFKSPSNCSLNSTFKWNQEQPRENDPYEDGDYSKMIYEAPNEVNFVGGIGPNLGHRRSKKFISRTTQIQQIYNMRNDNRTVFNFCEDPRLTTNVPPRRNVDFIEGKKLWNDTVGRISAIKHEQLPIVEASDPSIVTQQSLERNSDTLITGNNQENLKLRKQHLGQKRALLQQQLKSELPQVLRNEYLKQKFKISEYFNVDKNIPDDIDLESVREVTANAADWSEKVKVEAHPCDLKFGRPMPDVIPMPLEREKSAFLTRTLDKSKNLEKLKQETRKYSEPIEATVTKDFPYRETARELEKILEKQRNDNFSIELALKDFDEFMKNLDALSVPTPDVGKSRDPCQKTESEMRIAAMKEFEEKIHQQLTEFDENSSNHYSLDDGLEVTEDDTECRRKSSSEEIHFPTDFTYAFDISKNIKKSTKHEKAKKNRDSEARTIDATNKPNVFSHAIREKGNERNFKVKDAKEKESLCSNFTDDSGSFVVAQNKKLYLDRSKSVRKTWKFKIEKESHKFDVYLRPYEVLPLNEAKKLNQRNPKLVPTFDIKERLKVDVPQFDSELIGVNNAKCLSQLATEWDEYYQKEILNRPRIRRFKPRTIMKQVVDSLRLKYESIYKREYLTEKSIIIEQEKLFIKKAEHFRDFCTSFFSNLTTNNYRQSMAKIQELRPIYEKNDELTAEFTVLNNKMIQLKTAIIRTEGKFREAIILQNVSYLMKEPNWREKNDWIHKRADGSLETIKESIEKRMTTNLRKRDNDSVRAIKEFFETNIFNNQRPALVCFESSDAVNDAIVNFKVQLYLSLLKFDLSTWTLVNLKHAYDSYKKWCSEFIENRQKYVEARCARKYFQDSCATNMKNDAVELIGGELVEAISDKTLRTLEPLCVTLFASVVPKNVQEQLEGGDVLSKFRLIITHAMDMLERMDSIPSAKRKEIELNIRKEKGFNQRRTTRAVDLEAHIEKVKKVMMKHSSPPFRRPPRTGKLPRSYLQTSEPKSVPKIIPSDESVEMAHLTLTEQDFQLFLRDPPTQNDYYLDATFFGGDPEVPNIDFLPEIKSNINEFIVDVKNVLKKWERNKQERYLEDAHHLWTSNFTSL